MLAQALRPLLVRRHPAALFTIDTKRTRAALAPLAEPTKLKLKVYKPKESNVLAARIRQEYAGKMVIVVGHSNTLLPRIVALGGTSSIVGISDKEYSSPFTVRIPDGSTPPIVTAHSYRAKSKLTAAAKAEPMY